jgi:anti-sigma factor ChrR (cupin superfamily)
MVGQHLDDVFFDLALGTLDGDERAGAERHLGSCERCRRESAAIDELVASVGYAAPPLEMSPELRARVLASTGPSRFAPVRDKLAALFDLGREATDALLDTLDYNSTWKAGPLPGLRLARGQAGPAHEGSYAGFLRLQAGMRFPAHRHVGDESLLVLTGGLRLSSGRVMHAGDREDSAPGSTHDLVILDDEECIVAVVQHGGIEFGVKL